MASQDATTKKNVLTHLFFKKRIRGEDLYNELKTPVDP